MKQFLINHAGGVTQSNFSNIIHLKAGAKWTDEYPVDIWHDNSEEPQGDNWEILCIDDFDFCWVDRRVDACSLHNKWDEYAEVECVKMWAYISDLLPKGGEK